MQNIKSLNFFLQKDIASLGGDKSLFYNPVIGHQTCTNKLSHSTGDFSWWVVMATRWSAHSLHCSLNPWLCGGLNHTDSWQGAYKKLQPVKSKIHMMRPHHGGPASYFLAVCILIKWQCYFREEADLATVRHELWNPDICCYTKHKQQNLLASRVPLFSELCLVLRKPHDTVHIWITAATTASHLFLKIAQGFTVPARERHFFEIKEDEGTHLYGLDLLVVSSSQGRSDVTGWTCTNRSCRQWEGAANTNTDKNNISRQLKENTDVWIDFDFLDQKKSELRNVKIH